VEKYLDLAALGVFWERKVRWFGLVLSFWMKLVVKPLKGDQFEVEVEASNTTKEVKEKIASLKQWPVESQKLIHQGKILPDDKPLSEFKVKEGQFLVCMVAKAKAQTPATKTSTPAMASQEQPTSNTPSAPAPAPSASGSDVPSSTNPPAPVPASNPAPSAAASSTGGGQGDAFSGPEFEASLKSLQEMGFPEDQCRAALRAAFGNSERAVEYLMSGIPSNMVGGSDGSGNASATPSTSQAQPPGNTSSTTALSSASTDSGPLARVRQHPQFNEMRRLVQNNPTALSSVLQRLGSEDQELIDVISQNQAEFVAMMNEPIEEDSGGSNAAPASGFGQSGGIGGAGGQSADQLMQLFQAMQQMPEQQRAALAQQMGVPSEQLQAVMQMMQNLPPQQMAQMLSAMMGGMGGGGVGGGGGSGGGGGGGGDNVVRLTEEEMAAVNRLAELGFPKEACVEAYLACDKDEQVAANYLFTNPPDAMDDSSSQQQGQGSGNNDGNNNS